MKTNISNTASLLLLICSLVVSSCCREEQPCVSLISPANGATNIAPGNHTFTWSTSCPAADSFEVQFCTVSSFGGTTANGVVINPGSWRVRGTSLNKYISINEILYWRVRPLTPGVNQAWSQTFKYESVDNMTPRLGVYNNMTLEGWFYQGRTPYRDISQDRTGNITITRSDFASNYIVVKVQNNPSTLDTTEYIPMNPSNWDSYSFTSAYPLVFSANFNSGITQDSVVIDYPIYRTTGSIRGFSGNFFKIKGKK